jgi:hypothetical protein
MVVRLCAREKVRKRFSIMRGATEGRRQDGGEAYSCLGNG